MISRRVLLASGIAGAGLYGILRHSGSGAAAESNEKFAVTHTETEWRDLLTPEQFAVLRQGDTERPFSSSLLDEHGKGIFGCAGCVLDLFSSETKFDSHTGWPSFWKPLARAVGEQRDISFGMLRTEVHCSQCGGHLGHVFDDGPKPTGLRYCMNGVALTFRAASA